MAEVGGGMSQSEVAHHANRSLGYCCSRPEKRVHLYKSALPLATGRGRGADCEEDDDSAQEASIDKKMAKPSHLELYERRLELFFAENSLPSSDLPAKDYPEEQVVEVSLFDFSAL